MEKVEFWKKIAGYENYYVSSKGRVKSIDFVALAKTKKGKIRRIPVKGRIMKIHNGSKNYQIVSLTSQITKKRSTKKVHRLVAIAFIPNPMGKPQVNHIDGNKSNNNYENLEWVTNEENMEHAVKNNLTRKARGSKSGTSKLNENDVLHILSMISAGVKYSEIELKFNISKSTVSSIKQGRNWKWLTLSY